MASTLQAVWSSQFCALCTTLSPTSGLGLNFYFSKEHNCSDNDYVIDFFQAEFDRLEALADDELGERDEAVPVNEWDVNMKYYEGS